ncbi:MAG: gamma-glutamylcyclotransferase [Clostridia bacterium]|nr:gamma-glutamylcyclotransferase [Clostridia bacterium]
MERKYYIAYGSNLSMKAMKLRTPDARVVGTAMLQDYELVFRYYVTVEPKPGSEVPVLIWEITREDEENLDYYEGYPKLYFKKNVTLPVTPIDGEEPCNLTAMVYIMCKGQYPRRLPSARYYRVLKDSYSFACFDEAYLKAALFNSVGEQKAQAFLDRVDA